MALFRKVRRFVLPVLLVCWIGIVVFRSNRELAVTTYTIESDASYSIRIVQLSDLHSAEYGEDNAELITLVQAQKPDLIFMTGDMLNRYGNESDVGPLCSLVSRLARIAPLYWSDGNHERVFMRASGEDLHAQLIEAGAVVLDDRFVDVTVNGQEIRIGGYYGYYGVAHMITDDPAEEAEQTVFFREFEDTSRLKLLLCHIPTAWTDWGYIDKYPVDLVFSGHYHGGLIRLPFWDRGLYAPYVGWFPPFTKGVFPGTEGICILSVGLGSEYPVPRLNNPPEIVVTDLIHGGNERTT